MTQFSMPEFPEERLKEILLHNPLIEESDLSHIRRSSFFLKALAWFAGVSVATTAVISFISSYYPLAEVAALYGVRTAAIWPIMLDGVMFAATLSILLSASRGRRPKLEMSVLLLSVAGSVYFNIVDFILDPVTLRMEVPSFNHILIGIVAPVMYFLGVEILSRIIEHEVIGDREGVASDLEAKISSMAIQIESWNVLVQPTLDDWTATTTEQASGVLKPLIDAKTVAETDLAQLLDAKNTLQSELENLRLKKDTLTKEFTYTRETMAMRQTAGADTSEVLSDYLDYADKTKSALGDGTVTTRRLTFLAKKLRAVLAAQDINPALLEMQMEGDQIVVLADEALPEQYLLPIEGVMRITNGVS